MPLSDGLYDEINIADFEAGKTVYLSPTENNQVPNGLVGQTIQITYPNSEQGATYTIAGVWKPLTIKEWKEGENFNYNIGGIRDNQAVSDYGKHRIARIYRSVAGIRKISEDSIINQILLNVEPTIESTIKQQLMNVQGENSDVYLLAQSTYINTMTTTIYSRQLELATLESIGMTKKQLFKMLSFEGSTYAAFSIVLLTVLGVPLTYGLIQLVRETFYFLTFKPPILALLLVGVSLPVGMVLYELGWLKSIVQSFGSAPNAIFNIGILTLPAFLNIPIAIIAGVAFFYCGVKLLYVLKKYLNDVSSVKND